MQPALETARLMPRPAGDAVPRATAAAAAGARGRATAADRQPVSFAPFSRSETTITTTAFPEDCVIPV